MSKLDLMKLFFVLLTSAFICGPSTSQLVGLGEQGLKNYLRLVMDNFRNVMKVGSTKPRIPILDPLLIRDQLVKKREERFNITAQFSNIVIFGLSSYELDAFEVNLDDLKLTIGLSIPLLDAKGKYNLEGIVIKIFPLTGNGDVRVMAHNVKISGKAEFKVTPEGYLKVSKLDLGLDFSYVSINFQNLLGSKSVSDFVNRLLSLLGRPIFQSFKNDLLDDLENSLRKDMDKGLMKYKLYEILQGSIDPRDG
ncbi:uncharacterized protein LOC106468221 isoform X2 [Limulus polyphemus]|uniref:Uncharacterized protein LOC106468221 isoform X2 n=1 Tax=Limulus polyphemus TaxID=6850 RepID=A0ABM1BKZ8_LIMPO|nr:uncharacterized protein LOC106468221 isoform X2 [Limulus polyphemus]